MLILLWRLQPYVDRCIELYNRGPKPAYPRADRKLSYKINHLD